VPEKFEVRFTADPRDIAKIVEDAHISWQD